MTTLAPPVRAASGPGPVKSASVAVVLYDCVPPSHQGVDPGHALTRLGRYAAAKGWRVHRGYVDRVPLASLTAPRPEWTRVVEEIETGRAHGIVAPEEAVCAYYPEQRDQLRTWLTAHRAFAVYTVGAGQSAAPGTRLLEGARS